MFASTPEKEMNVQWSKLRITVPFLITHKHLNKFTLYKLKMRPIETNESSSWMFLLKKWNLLPVTVLQFCTQFLKTFLLI